MHGLGHFYLSWGLLVQAFALIHFLRRRPESYWFFVILFFGWLGAAVYIIAEVIPDLGLLRDTMQGFGRRSRIQKVETDILDNPSAANYEELGELYKDQHEYAKGREAFTQAISARSDSIYTFYSRAQCSLALNDLAAAIPDLEYVVASDRKFDYYRAAGLLADAYSRTRQLDRAESLFTEVTQISTTPETLYNYASFLKTANRREEWNSPVTSYPPGGVEVRERETQGGTGVVAVAAVGKWESRSDFQAEWKSRSLTFPRSGFSTAVWPCPAGKIAAPWPLPVAILI